MGFRKAPGTRRGVASATGGKRDPARKFRTELTDWQRAFSANLDPYKAQKATCAATQAQARSSLRW
jgi:hypothetical protein